MLERWRGAGRTAATLIVMLVCTSAPAAVIIETPGPLTDSSSRPSGVSWGILARVDVGGANVAINQIAVKGQVFSSTILKFVLYQGSAFGSLPALQTATQNLPAPTATQYFQSEQFPTFTLQANTTYWIGYACDGALNSFTSFYNLPGSSFSANGLTLPGGINANVRTGYATPTLDATNTGFVQASVRLSLIPEPGSMASIALVGCVVACSNSRDRSARRREAREARETRRG